MKRACSALLLSLGASAMLLNSVKAGVPSTSITAEGTDISDVPKSNIKTSIFTSDEGEDFYVVNVWDKVHSKIIDLNSLSTGFDYKSSTFDKTNSLIKNHLANAKGIQATVYETESVSNSRRDLSTSLNSKMTYLIDNNVFSRDFTLTYGVADNEPVIDCILDPDSCSYWGSSSGHNNNGVLKSDWLMWLYSAAYGSIESRPVAISTANMGITKDDVIYKTEFDNTNHSSYNFYESWYPGDFYTFTTNDVYELYFTKLLEKKIIKEDEFSSAGYGKEFLNEYHSYLRNGNVSWAKDSGLAFLKDNALGHSYTYRGDNFSGSLCGTQASYFSNEQLTTVDALRYVESILRLTEKDMTQTEANIVSYKYGASNLSKLHKESDRKTIMFLIAKGILNFEEPDEFINVYDKFTVEDAITLLYRVANKNARLNFSEIQLTDQQAFWQQRGYYEYNIGYTTSDKVPFSVESVKPAQKYEQAAFQDKHPLLYSIASLMGLQYSYSASGQKTWYVKMRFTNDCQCTFDGIPANSLRKENAPDIIESAAYDPDDDSVNVVVFKVVADTSSEAVSIIYGKLESDNQTDLQILSCVISKDYETFDFNFNDKSDVSIMVPATQLKSLGSIAILADKVLCNKKTGTLALLSADLGYAVVGNEVITVDKKEDLMVVDTTGEVYYSLAVVHALLTSTDLYSIATPLGVIVTETNDTIVPVTSKVHSVLTEGNTKATLANLLVSKLGSANYYRISSAQSSGDALYRTFYLDVPVKDSNEMLKIPITVLVEWQYVVPSKEANNSNKLCSYKSGLNLTASSVSKMMYETPNAKKEPVLLEWWKSNVTVSNMLCNFLFGTTGITYVDCGYYCPSVYFLIDCDADTIAESLPVGSSNASLYKRVKQLIREMFTAIPKDASTFVGSDAFWMTNYYENKKGLKNEYLKKLANKSRQFAIFTAKTDASGCKIFNKRFPEKDTKDKTFFSANGVLYQKFNSKIAFNQIELNSTRNTASCISTRTTARVPAIGKEVIVHTTVDPDSRASQAQVLKYNGFKAVGNKSYFTFSYDKALGNGYYLKFNLKNSGDQWELDTSSSSANPIDEDNWQVQLSANMGVTKIKAIETCVDKLRTTFGCTGPNDTFEFGCTDEFIESVAGDSTGPIYFYVSPKTLKVFEKGKISTVKFSPKKAEQLKDKVVYTSVVFDYLAGDSSFYLKESNKKYYLVGGTRINALNDGYVYRGGVALRVINYAIARNSAVLLLDELEDGTVVMLGDITCYKQTIRGIPYLISKPVTSSTVLPDAINYAIASANKSAFTASVGSLLSGQTITVGGQIFALADYVQEVDIGEVLNKSDVTENTVCANTTNSFKIMTKNGKYKKVNSNTAVSAKAAVIKLQFTPNTLLLRPLNSSLTVYTFYGAVTGSKGLYETGTTLYKDESLDFNLNLPVAINMYTQQYSDLVDWENEKKNFNDKFNTAFISDLKNRIKWILLIVTVFLTFMGWLALWIKSTPIADVVINKTEVFRRKSGKKINLIQILSFGVFKSTKRLTIQWVLLFTLISAFVVWLILTYF